MSHGYRMAGVSDAEAATEAMRGMYEECTTELMTLWDEIGTGKAEREQQMKGLLEAVKDVFQGTVAQQEQLKQGTKDSIAQVESGIIDMCRKVEQSPMVVSSLAIRAPPIDFGAAA